MLTVEFRDKKTLRLIGHSRDLFRKKDEEGVQRQVRGWMDWIKVHYIHA